MLEEEEDIISRTTIRHPSFAISRSEYTILCFVFHADLLVSRYIVSVLHPHDVVSVCSNVSLSHVAKPLLKKLFFLFASQHATNITMAG